MPRKDPIEFTARERKIPTVPMNRPMTVVRAPPPIATSRLGSRPRQQEKPIGRHKEHEFITGTVYIKLYIIQNQVNDTRNNY